MKMPGDSAIRIAASLYSLVVTSCSVIPEKEQAAPFRMSKALEDAGDRADEGQTAPLSKAIPEVAPEEEERLIYFSGQKGTLPVASPSDDLDGRTISLAFSNAPAGDVARTVIADILGETVAIADGVGGTITLAAPDPVPASDALAALETALAESGLALLRVRSGFILAPIEAAAKETAKVSGGSAIGYGAVLAPVRNASPAEVAGLIQPFLSERVIATPDDARGVILLKGPRADIESAMEAIATFDTAQLTDRTFGMFRLRFADASAVRTEIAAVMDASTVGGGSPVELISLPRLNLIYVTARTKSAFEDVQGWIERLDRPAGGDVRRLRYLPVLNASAEILAEQLGGAGGGESSSGVSTTGGDDASGSSVQPSFQTRSVLASAGGGPSISVDAINNALIIRATDQEYREILDLVERMDVAAPQVLIEATIAEVTLNDDLSFGVRWFFENVESRLTLSDTATGAVAPVFPGLGYTFIESDARVALNTLASVTDVSVLSAPSITVLNNQTASLQVGDEVPIVTQQAQSVIDNDAPIVQTLQLRETGVILEVKPRINAGGTVVLEISQEVSDVAPTTTSGIDSPTIQQRRFSSTVSVRDNGTIALGGLIRETYSDNESGVPLLKDIPLLGYAFKSRDIIKRRTELVIFLTPRIIRTDDDARAALVHLRREMTRLFGPSS